jgi:uncharacterized membrane protein YphA (DoxX/SURF4 family)
MKRLPIYALLITGYAIILWGVSKLYNGLKRIEVIDIPATQTTTTQIDIIPAIILAVFVLIIVISVGVYLITELWKYLVAHKTLLPIPFLLIALGFINLANKVMEGVSIMIENNAEQFTENLSHYIESFSSLGTHTLIGLIFIALSVVYSVLLKRGIIFA